MTRQRIFTEEYELNQQVAIIRTRHGWFNGNEVGIITEISPHGATVTTEEGDEYEIEHCRDIIAC